MRKIPGKPWWRIQKLARIRKSLESNVQLYTANFFSLGPASAATMEGGGETSRGSSIIYQINNDAWPTAARNPFCARPFNATYVHFELNRITDVLLFSPTCSKITFREISLIWLRVFDRKFTQLAGLHFSLSTVHTWHKENFILAQGTAWIACWSFASWRINFDMFMRNQ